MEIQLLYTFIVFYELYDAQKLDGSTFSDVLDTLADNGLGTNAMQDYLDQKVQYSEETLDGQDIIEEVSSNLQSRLSTQIDTVKKLRDELENIYAYDLPQKHWPRCCGSELDNIEYNDLYGTKVDISTLCIHGEGLVSNMDTFLPDSILKVMKSNFHPSIKWQMFGTHDEIQYVYPAAKPNCDQNYNPTIQPWFKEAAFRRARDVVLIIDVSNSMDTPFGSKTRIAVARDAGEKIINMLTLSDRVGIVAFNSHSQTPAGLADTSTCYSDTLATASPPNVQYLKLFIRNLKALGGSDYKGALLKGFSFFEDKPGSVSDERDKVIIFMSDGVPSGLNDQNDIVNIIRDENAKLHNQVIILTFGLGDGLTPDGLQLLERMATQNNHNASAGELRPGRFIHITNKEELSNAMTSFYNMFTIDGDIPEAAFSVPYLDPWDGGVVSSVCLPVHTSGDLVGVVCVAVRLQDLQTDIDYYQQGEDSYAFLLSHSGYLLMHPLVPVPFDSDDDPHATHYTSIERVPAAQDVIMRMLRGEDGKETVLATRIKPRGDSSSEGVRVEQVQTTYYYKQIIKNVLSVCMVLPNNAKFVALHLNNYPASFVYHRLDIKPVGSVDVCSHFQRLCIRGISSVKFTPGAFVNPSTYQGIHESWNQINQYEIYFTGKSQNNPGFKKGIRELVAVSFEFDRILDQRPTSYEYSIWRYIGWELGFHRTFPAHRVADSFDPTVRKWYNRAKTHAGKNTLSVPYVDASGAGLIITLSKAIFVGRLSGVHTKEDQVLGVMGMDFSMSYLYQQLTSTFTICKEDRYECFILDDNGLIVVHKSFFNCAADLEQSAKGVHIAQQDQSIAHDLIERGIMTKQACVNFKTIENQYYWRVEMPPGDKSVITDWYELHYVTNSNVYVGIKNKEYTGGFRCSCSGSSLSTDCRRIFKGSERLKCQNSRCECPCSDNAEFQFCADRYTQGVDGFPTCVPDTPKGVFQDLKAEEAYELQALEKCYLYNCHERLNDSICTSVITCGWCDPDVKEEVGFCAPVKDRCQSSSKDDINGGKKGNKALVIGASVGSACLLILTLGGALLVIYRRRKYGDSVGEDFSGGRPIYQSHPSISTFSDKEQSSQPSIVNNPGYDEGSSAPATYEEPTGYLGLQQ